MPTLYMELTIYKYLKVISKLKKGKSNEVKPSLDKIMELVNIMQVNDRLTRNLAKLDKQIIGLAQIIIWDTQIIILDEITVGLDPRNIIEIRHNEVYCRKMNC
ncbi:hypothetical protein [Clostridium thermarum]|uniref:hypothetical protein n=1 Tax=Clostridium thermarum TaxID=1716543 RepID=UPI001120352F|nr:hypothetical protein [Clostridium thermarum]